MGFDPAKTSFFRMRSNICSSYYVCGFEFLRIIVLKVLKMTGITILKNQNHSRAGFGYVFGKRTAPEL